MSLNLKNDKTGHIQSLFTADSAPKAGAFVGLDGLAIAILSVFRLRRVEGGYSVLAMITTFLILSLPVHALDEEGVCRGSLASPSQSRISSQHVHFFHNEGSVVAHSYANGSYRDSSSTTSAQNLQGMRRAQEDLRYLIQPYLVQAQPPYLEVGPFYNSILRPDSGDRTVYWEMDIDAIEKLANKATSQTEFVHVDLNRAIESRSEFVEFNRNLIRGQSGFGAVVISQVLNYVDYKGALVLVSSLQESGGLLFIVNAVKHGDSAYFHPRRPRSIEDIPSALTGLGYEILERKQRLGFVQTVTWAARKK